MSTRLQCIVAAGVIAAASAAPIFAQDGLPAPAPELKKLTPLVGSWRGSGVMTPQAGAPQFRWTSTHCIDWVLDGHFLREDTRIEFPDGQMPPLVFRTYFGFDREHKRFRMFVLGNRGMVKLRDLTLTDDGAIVEGGHAIWSGEVIVDRWVTSIKDDRMTLSGREAHGTGDFFVSVNGVAMRSKDKLDVAVAETSAKADGAAPIAMQPVARCVGDYSFKGRMAPMPGAPMVDIGGRETARMILDGCALEWHTVGDPVAGGPGKFEGIGYLAWDDSRQCYLTCGFANTGEIHSSEARFDGESKLVMTFSGLQHGKPVAGRGVLEFGTDGAMTRITADSIAGTDPAQRVFEGTYSRSK